MTLRTPTTLRFSWNVTTMPEKHFIPQVPHRSSEVSRFSPPSSPGHSQTHTTWGNSTPMRDIESGRPRSTMTNIRDRFTKLFFDMRAMRHPKEPEVAPAEPTQLPPWAPLHIEKRGQCCEHCVSKQQRKKKKKKQRRILLIILIILLLYLLGSTIFTTVRAVNPQTTYTSPPQNSTTSVLSADAQSCLSQYNINAPVSPSSYPCSTCFPILQSVPANFSDGNAQDAQQIQNAIQFCGLRSIFTFANSQGQSALGNASWVQNVDFCGWGGVQCNGNGQVSSLQLTFPSVPATLPDEIGGLTGLETLEVIGGTTIPAGTLPSSFTSLTALSTLSLQSTAITPLPDGLFSSLKRMATLTLVKNAQMNGSLPSSLTQIPLQNLVVNQQILNNPLSNISSSSTLQSSLKILDLSLTSLGGSIPSSISSLSSLTELHLASNELIGSVPSSFPSALQLLDLSNNTGLSGTVSGSFCSLTDLQSCDVSGTGLRAAGSCGVCTFS